MAGATQDFDAVVIGAGFSGMHMLKSLRDKLGLKVRVYEAGETVGGTWYWNRYPGARCDSDAYIYCFTWDKQLLQEWQWSERYPEQPEILRYLEHVAERHDLKRDMQFNTRVTGRRIRRDHQPVDGAHRQGRRGHGALPHRRGRQPVDHERAAVQGPGDIQGQVVSIPAASRTPASTSPASAWPWSAPAPPRCRPFPKSRSRPSNSRCSSAPPTIACRRATARWIPRWSKARKADYDGVVKRIRESFFGQEHYFIPKSALEATPEEREREFDRMWDAGGFAFWLANYQDMFFSQEANDLCADYIKRKIRSDRERPGGRREADPQGLRLRHQAPAAGHQLLRDLQQGQRAAGRCQDRRRDRGDHRKGHPRRRQGIRVRHHRFRHRLRCHDRPAEGAEPEGPRRPHAGRGMGGRPAHLSWHLGRRLPQPVHHHRPAKPVGAVEHAGRRSSSMWSGSPTASTPCARPARPPSRRRPRRRTNGSRMSTRSSARR